MTAIGDKQILATQTLLLADGDVGRFDVRVGETTLPVTVRFSRPHDGEASWEWEFDQGTLALNFTGWNRPGGAGFTTPRRLGEIGSEPLGFNMAHQRLGEMNVATLQFYLGGTYE